MKRILVKFFGICILSGAALIVPIAANADDCTELYASCIARMGQTPGSVYGTSQCADCFRMCFGVDVWPFYLCPN